MDIFEKTIKEYQIIPQEGESSEWGAKGVIFTPDGKLETEEFTGKTREEAVRKAELALNELIHATQKSAN